MPLQTGYSAAIFKYLRVFAGLKLLVYVPYIALLNCLLHRRDWGKLEQKPNVTLRISRLL